MELADDDSLYLRAQFARALAEAGHQASHAAYLAITDAAATLQQQVSALLSEHALSLTQYSALRAIRRSEGIRLAELSAEMVHRAPDASRLVERLVKLGLIERCPDACDRRAVRLRLTPDGRHQLVGIDRLMLELHERQFDAFGNEELRRLVKALTSLTEA